MSEVLKAILRIKKKPGKCIKMSKLLLSIMLLYKKLQYRTQKVTAFVKKVDIDS